MSVYVALEAESKKKWSTFQKAQVKCFSDINSQFHSTIKHFFVCKDDGLFHSSGKTQKPPMSKTENTSSPCFRVVYKLLSLPPTDSPQLQHTNAGL